MQKNIRTDLVLEARELFKEQLLKESRQEQELKGVEVINAGTEDIKITRVKVISPLGAENVGKPMGNYVTIEVPRLRENDENLYENTCKVMAQELAGIINLKSGATILIVGLGNWNVTPDALGPKVVSKVMVTRHMTEHAPEQVKDGVRPVCAVAPGVLGITGIETGEIIKGIVDKVRPDLVIAIDALASRKMDRVSTTIQLADTGISPGSGVGNKRMALSKDTLGVPVIAVGVPTVVDAATIANDTMDLVLEAMLKNIGKDSLQYNTLKNMQETEKLSLIQEVLSPYVGNLLVTPKEIDELIDRVSGIISNALNIALHESVDSGDIGKYVH